MMLILSLFAACKVSNTKQDIHESISYNVPTIESTTLSYFIDANNQINLMNFSFQIPQNFTIEDNEQELILKNEDGSIQFSVEDKTNEIINMDNYIEETKQSIEQMGLSPQETKNVHIVDCSAKKFIFDTFDIANEKITYYCYFVETENSKLLINVISKNETILNEEIADEFVSNIILNSN